MICVVVAIAFVAVASAGPVVDDAKAHLENSVSILQKTNLTKQRRNDGENVVGIFRY